MRQAFLRGHSTKQTPGILTMVATKYSLITSRKQGSTTTTAVFVFILQWPSNISASTQDLTTVLPGGVPTITQWSDSPKFFGLKQVLSALAMPFLWLQTQDITKSNTSDQWKKESQSVMATVISTQSKMTTWDNSKPVDRIILKTPYRHL